MTTPIKTIPTQPKQATNAVAVTKSDVTVLQPTLGLYVGTTGDVAAVMAGGNTVTFTAVPAGTLLPISVVQVLNTGTTAGAIVALY